MHCFCPGLQRQCTANMLRFYQSVLMGCEKDIKTESCKFRAPVFLHRPIFLSESTMIDTYSKIRLKLHSFFKGFLCRRYRINYFQSLKILFTLPDIHIIRDNTDKEYSETIIRPLENIRLKSQPASLIDDICRNLLCIQRREKRFKDIIAEIKIMVSWNIDGETCSVEGLSCKKRP